MFHTNPTGKAITQLGPTAMRAVDAIQAMHDLHIRSGAVQIRIFHKDIGQLGGLSTQERGQYLLTTAADGRISDERLRAQGFQLKTRSNGSHYWYQPGHDDCRNLIATLGEMTGRVV